MLPASPYSLALLGTLLAIAVIRDLGSRRIPNALVLAVAALGLGLRLWGHGPLGALSGLGAGLVVGVLLWGPWSAGRIGGGDLKLAVAASFAVGFGALPLFLLTTALAGGVVSLLAYAASTRAARAQVRANLGQAAFAGTLPRAAKPSARAAVPYAAAIALGALVTLGFGG